MEPQDLNNNCDYNDDYNIFYSGHVLVRGAKRLLDFEKLEQTIANGKMVHRKTAYPKICKRCYFGKENATYFVIFIETKIGIKVITAWSQEGN